MQYSYWKQCRRRAILAYFGDSSDVANCACDVCRGDGRSRPSERSPESLWRRERRTKTPAGEERPLDAAAAVRFDRLKKTRLELAKAEKQPAFCVAHDSVLRDLARIAPQSLAALAHVRGIGDDKLEKFGAAFLEAVKQS